MFASHISDTTAHDAADIHRSAYNAAFHELGLRWHWDAGHYESALPASQEKAHLLSYLRNHQAHLLKAYDAEFLADAITSAKCRCYETLLVSGSARPGVNWAEMQQPQVGH
ncbi:HAD family hydrolase [Noviherbaspirillum soli]|uniref:hypothetical protein n=1 Tax=Noviherbaspirillum soli TaxID=1064518 RepID=UPI00188D878F|nr:hypothetical protein [Noviherbaspirillum soli]